MAKWDQVSNFSGKHGKQWLLGLFCHFVLGLIAVALVSKPTPLTRIVGIGLGARQVIMLCCSHWWHETSFTWGFLAFAWHCHYVLVTQVWTRPKPYTTLFVIISTPSDLILLHLHCTLFQNLSQCKICELHVYIHLISWTTKITLKLPYWCTTYQ